MKKFRDLIEGSRVEDNGTPSNAAATLRDKPNKEPMPKLKEESDTKEKVEMAQSQLHFIHYACEEILEFIDDGGEVEEWYQVKIAKAFSEFESLHSYMEGKKRRTGMVKEAMSQPDYSQSIKARQTKADKDRPPFDGGKPVTAKKSVVPGKYGVGPSTAKHLAKTAMQRQMKKEDTDIDEATGDPKFDKMMKRVTGKKEVSKQQKADTKQQARDAFGSMFGGGNPANKLGIRKPGVKEDVEQIDEGRPSQRHPLEGHEYHKKSNVALVHIAKDAHKAAESMKGHNTNAENKYRDQANDSATVRYFRQKSGMPDWYKKKYGHMKEDVEYLDEKNVPTSPEKWARAKAQAKSKFDVYPSAYANGWAAKKYKEMGGGWRSVNEEEQKTEPFYTSSRKTRIVKDLVKKNNKSEKFESDPILTTSMTRNT